MAATDLSSSRRLKWRKKKKEGLAVKEERETGVELITVAGWAVVG